MKNWIRSKHTHLALLSGVGILLLALVSRYMLSEPMNPLLLTLPALTVTAAEGAFSSEKDAWYTRTGPWLIAVVLVTLVTIGWHLI